MNLMIYTLSNGDRVHRYSKSIVIPFGGARKVLSTAPLNGGYWENLTAVFNNDGNPGAGMACVLRAPTYEAHMRLIASELGLDPDKTAGIGTAASMENVSIKSESFENLTVTAIVTGGVEVNGGRAGDPASFHERGGKTEMLNHGTINIILAIDADLPEGTMARALVTCTEAKTAALQELMAGSNYSSGVATGSGTDGTILICNPMSGIALTNAGKHSKLGELIGRSVKAAVKEALFKQSGLCPGYQHSILRRTKRYGINEEKLWLRYLEEETGEAVSKADFIHRLHMLEKTKGLVTLTSLFVHVLDQLEWRLLDPEEAAMAGHMLLEIMKREPDILSETEMTEAGSKKAAREGAPEAEGILPSCFAGKVAGVKGEGSGIEDIRKELLDHYTALIADIARGEYHV